MKETKTNAMRILEQAHLPFETLSYEVDESDLSGTHIARTLGLDEQQVFKTLVARANRYSASVSILNEVSTVIFRSF